VSNRRGCLGCGFPVVVGVLVVFIALFIVGFLSGPIGKNLVGDIGLPSWISVPQPEPHLPPDAVFHIGSFPITNSVIAAWLSIVVLVALSCAATRRMKIIPPRFQMIFESVMGWLYDFCKQVAGEDNGRRFFPIVTTIFLFVIANAWLGLLPGFGSIEAITADGHHVHLFRAANTDINLPLAIALMSFVFVEFFGLRSRGIGYLKKFINVGSIFRGFGMMFKGKPKAGLGTLFNGVINAFIGFLEGLSEFIRIISFTFRLFGNMTAGEILIMIVIFLVPWLAAIPFYGLELLVGFVQALIFGGLTLVFLTVAITPHEAEAH